MFESFFLSGDITYNAESGAHILPLVFPFYIVSSLGSFTELPLAKAAEEIVTDRKIFCHLQKLQTGENFSSKKRLVVDDHLVNPDGLYEIITRWLPGELPALNNMPAELESSMQNNDLIDIAHLALFTDGDLEQEKMLADAFVAVGLESLQILEEHLQGKNSTDSWRMAAHKLKGSSAQIGANKLAAVCLVAERGANDNAEQKGLFLRDIKMRLEEVSIFFKGRHI